MKGLNNDFDDMLKLEQLLGHMDVEIKFMTYSEKDELYITQASDSTMMDIEDAIDHFNSIGMKAEYYESASQDIGASCGQFLTQLEQLEIEGTITTRKS